MPTSPLDGLHAHVCRGQPMRLMAPHCILNPAFIHPFDAPTFRQRGVMWAGIATSKAWETAKGEASCANPLLSAAGVEGLGLMPSDS